MYKGNENKKPFIAWKNILCLLAGLCVGALAAAGVCTWIGRSADDQAGSFSAVEDNRTLGKGSEAENQEQAITGSQLIELKEIEYPSDFTPFSHTYESGRLVLCAKPQEDEGGLGDLGVTPQFFGYQIRVYDGDGGLIQELPCDIEAEELIFRFDGSLHYYNHHDDFEIFPADAEETGADGLLFYWDDEAERFFEEPIVIPWYEELDVAYRAYLLKSVDGNVETESLCRFSEGTKELVELRRLVLTYPAKEGEAGYLQIENCVEQVTLYDGEVEINGLGEPVNNKYYQLLFSMNLETFWDYKADEEISVFNWNWDGERDHYEILTYADREAFLTEFGFAGEEPFYEYYDTQQDLLMELWFDERTGRGCGLFYRCGFNYEAQEIMRSYGFAFDHVKEEKWEPEDTYSTLSYYGTDAKSPNVSGYQEIYAYTDDGKLSSFEARGTITDYGEGGERWEDSLLFMDYYYRDDGTLFFKRYEHHHILFGSTYQGQSSYYDEQERPVYRVCYITSGSVEYFYIYEGDGEEPAYCLSLDCGGGVHPAMILYK